MSTYPARPPDALTARPMTESQVMTGIERAAKQLGFCVYHTRYAIGSGPGFPDLIVCGYGELRAWEIKGPRGRVSPVQTAWIEALQAAGVGAQIVWPQDYEDVLAELQDIYERRTT